MADELGREIDFGVEDGRPKGNWREGRREPGRNFGGNLADTQGAHGKEVWENVNGLSMGPRIHKGARVDEPTIGDCVRAQRKESEE